MGKQTVIKQKEKIQLEQQNAQLEADKRKAEAEKLRLEVDNARLEAEKQKAEAERQKAISEKLEAEKAQLEAEVSFLKMQFNPHFLYNTLNFMYGRSMRISRQFPEFKDLPEAIMKLSEIMRYSVTDHPEATVPLPEEIRYLQTYIAIHQIQAKNELQVEFDIQGETDHKRILPLTLISFVENAFKHGELRQVGDPLTIRLTAQNGHIDFLVRNRKAPQRHFPSTGIGSQNIKKRLDLTYKNNYTLTTHDEDEYYSTHLHIYA